MSKLLFKSNWFPFWVLTVTGCLLSAWLRYENNWDLANYHYYNAWAFLNGRLNYDIVPASVNTFFNPLSELPFYFLIEYFNDYPAVVYGVQGIWFGLLLFVFYKICLLFFDCETWAGRLGIAAAILAGASGYALWFQIGSTTNEVPLALTVLAVFYLLLRELEKTQQRLFLFLGCGLLLGAALGLKPTAAVYCLSAGMTLIIFYRRLQKPLPMIVLFALGGLLGYLAVNGWWMWKLWELYDNPFFPFLNGVFHSPYFDDFNFRDNRYLPSLPEALWFPYLWWTTHGVSEEFFIDFRIPLVYTLGVIFLTAALLRKKIGFYWREYPRWCFLVVFMLLSYSLWLMIFAIIRYLIVVEMLAAIVLVKAAIVYAPSKRNWAVIIYWTAVIFVFHLLLRAPLDSFDFGNRRRARRVIAVEKVKLPENTLLKLYNFPSAALAAVWGKQVSLRALGYMQYNGNYMQGSDFAERGKFREMRDVIEKEHRGPAVIVYRENYNALYDKKIRGALQTEGMFCRRLRTNLDRGLHICVPEELKDKILQPRRRGKWHKKPQ